MFGLQCRDQGGLAKHIIYSARTMSRRQQHRAHLSFIPSLTGGVVDCAQWTGRAQHLVQNVEDLQALIGFPNTNPAACHHPIFATIPIHQTTTTIPQTPRLTISCRTLIARMAMSSVSLVQSDHFQRAKRPKVQVRLSCACRVICISLSSQEVS